jgi:hypothetical protein
MMQEVDSQLSQNILQYRGTASIKAVFSNRISTEGSFHNIRDELCRFLYSSAEENSAHNPNLTPLY